MHTRKYYLAIKNEILPFAAIWMEGTMLSEVSQTEKDKYCISLICGIYKIEQTGESACNAGDPGLIPGLGRSPGEGNGNPLQYSCLENTMDRGARQAIVHGVARVGHDSATKPPPQ